MKSVLAGIAAFALVTGAAPAGADPGPFDGPDPNPDDPSVVEGQDIFIGHPLLRGALLCPGGFSNDDILAGFGGSCDFGFTPAGHMHCEWGGYGNIVDVTNCWPVRAGDPDRPAPDVVVDLSAPPPPDAPPDPPPPDG